MLFNKAVKKIEKNSSKETEERKIIIEIKDLNLWIDGNEQFLFGINIKIPEYSIVSIIGPSGAGKSSLLRAMNKTNFGGKYTYSGEINLYGVDVLDKKFPIDYLRTQIGTVLQKPVMFPMSIRDNVLFALKAHGLTNSSKLELILEKSLRDAHIWEEVKDRLNSLPEETLSIGQKQRLCIARAISLGPKVLLMDEPTSALDRKSSNKIEELIRKIARDKISTIVLISHSLAQVKRISDYTVFIKGGVVIEQGRTKDIFSNPQHQETKEFLSGTY